MKLSSSPYVFLSLSVCLCFVALGLLPKIDGSAVDIGQRHTMDCGEPPTPEPAAVPVEPAYDPDPVHKVVDQMPLWPGSEDAGSYQERKRASDELMLAYIYDNVKYPKKARKKGIEGMAVVSFVIEKDGRVSNINVVRDPGVGTGDEAARVVRQMAHDDIYWHPGRQKGQPVRVQFNLPVKFKLK